MNEALRDTYNPIYDILIKINSNIHNPTHSRTLYPLPTLLHPHPILLCPPSTGFPHPFPSHAANILRK
jgi:hypothetical protein